MTSREAWLSCLAAALLGCFIGDELSMVKARRLLWESLQRENATKLELDVLRRSIYVLPSPEHSLPPELKRELET